MREEFETSVLKMKDELEGLGLGEEKALEKAVDAALFGKQRVRIEVEIETPVELRGEIDLAALAEEYDVRCDHTEPSEVGAEIYRELLKKI